MKAKSKELWTRVGKFFEKYEDQANEVRGQKIKLRDFSKCIHLFFLQHEYSPVYLAQCFIY